MRAAEFLFKEFRDSTDEALEISGTQRPARDRGDVASHIRTPLPVTED